MQPFVSIVILNWNGEKYIKSCINSVLNLDYRNFDIIIVDNCSTDNSVKMLKRSFLRYMKKGKIKLILNNSNLGVPEGNNVGIRLALSSKKVKYVALINPDTKVERSWLSELIKIIHKDKSIGAVQGKILKFDKKTIDSAGILIHNSIINAVDVGICEIDKGQYDQPKELMAICGAGAIYRVEALRDIEYFREYMDSDFFCMWEDIDMSVRIFLSGWRIFYLPNAVMYHMRSASTGKHTPFSTYYLHRNNLWFMVKCVPFRSLIKRIPLIFMFDMVTFLFFSIFKPYLIRPFINAKIDSFRGLGKMLHKRKFIMKNCVSCKRFEDFIERRFFSKSFEVF